ncbi:TVP38/TMEM64 family protein [Xylanibacillus composti]|uniref:TVP38/TMEM64 family membrane protein n=1 Tax=Xylanibacillus composti TaxID=1572762 RepID=A0A8J4GYG1_9BACL|nr:VTT domain-containing protein [Xylanibacillus composti]MDT9725769.1 TVP38/TMEM64 family protein [Xylanibacillus composti]GIQ67517.1 hypothetical protein XYCOK13_03410 [Xylanibacillus composti]
MGIHIWVRVLSFSGLLLLLVVALRSEPAMLLLSGDLQALRELAGGSVGVLMLATLALMIIQNLFTIIPLILLISVNVSLFGFTYGYLWSWVCSIAGGVVSFLAVRYWFQSLFAKRMNERLKDKIEGNGFLFVFLGRIFPFVPTSAVNIAAGISSIRLSHFVYSTMIGNLLYFFVLALVGLGILSIRLEKAAFFTLGGAVVVAYVSYRIWRGRRKKLQNRDIPG